jgi:hypothetical protein
MSNFGLGKGAKLKVYCAITLLDFVEQFSLNAKYRVLYVYPVQLSDSCIRAVESVTDFKALMTKCST